MAELANIAANGNYPSDDGIRMGLASTVDTSLKPVVLMDVELLVGGTPGTGASYEVEVETQNGNWLPTGILLSGNGAAATGVVCGTVEGCAVRLAATNGSGAGTTTATPRYHLGVTPRHRKNIGEYTG